MIIGGLNTEPSRAPAINLIVAKKKYFKTPRSASYLRHQPTKVLVRANS